VALGLPAALIGRGLSKVTGVSGRLERVGPRNGRAPTVFVDYAHTPDALARALAALRPLTTGSHSNTSPGGRRGRLIVVFGCGGDRDVGKRPQMGHVAARDADVVVITSDNPRTESPQAIIDAIVAGVAATTSGGIRAPGPLPRLDRAALAGASHGYHIEPDRRQAITAAILGARADDVVLLAGKGHEDYQIVGTARHRFDDREEAQRALSQRESTPPRSTGGASGVMTIAVPSTIELPLERVLAATQGKLVRTGPHKFTAVTIDSRTASAGSLFVAVRGERHDGHSFIAQAVAAGATGLLVEPEHQSEFERIAGITVVEVPDTVVALGQLARAHREAPEIASRLRVVAVTGSSGKTTTKDLIAATLTAHTSDPTEVLKTEGNLNNHLGVPLTLLRLRPGQRYAVVEMGMSARGEIAYLTSLARPDVGVITNVGPAHLSSLGTVENVALAKGELYTGLNDGAAAVYLVSDGESEDDAMLKLVHKQAVRAGALSGRLRSFCAQAVHGDAPAAASAVVQTQLRGETEDGLDLVLHFPTQASAGQPAPLQLPAILPLLGAHQAKNAALAAAAGMALDIPPATIAAGLQRVTPGKHRGQLVVIAGRRVLDDCYNANPDSMAAALHTVAALRGGRSAVAILGDMLELGAGEAAMHAQIGQIVADCGVNRLITVGERARHIAAAAQRLGVPTEVAATADDAARAAAAATEPGDFILLKGSRGMALEGVLERLQALLEDPAAPGAAQQVH
jgi:murE/murF fusion protein